MKTQAAVALPPARFVGSQSAEQPTEILQMYDGSPKTVHAIRAEATNLHPG
jgi:hypothetical protein